MRRILARARAVAALADALTLLNFGDDHDVRTQWWRERQAKSVQESE